MAELTIDLADLPVATSEEITNSPNITVVINGKSRLMTWAQLTTWIADNVQGEKGDQGADGNNGLDGTNGVSPTHEWNGTTLSITSASGTSSSDLKGEKGDQGDVGEKGEDGTNGNNGTNGTNGTNGWSPVFATELYTGKQLIKITNWTGGTGTKPTINVYLSPTGLTPDISLATDFKGASGSNGTNGLGISTAAFDASNNLTLTMSDATTITAESTKSTGVIQYIDTASTILAQQFVADVLTKLSNDADNVKGVLPNSWSFYDTTTNKILLPEVGFYKVIIEFLSSTTSLGQVLGYLDRSGTSSDVIAAAKSAIDGEANSYFRMDFDFYADSISSENGVFIKLKGNINFTAKNVKMIVQKIN